MHGKKSHQMLKSMLEGAALGGVLSAALIFGAWANAAGAGAADAIPAEYVDLCEQAGEEHGICPEILEAVMLEESGGDPDAVGRARSRELTGYAERVLERARQLEQAHGK